MTNNILSMTPEEAYEAGYTAGSMRDWTPCAEGLPKKVDYRLWSKNVLATVEQKTGERYVIEAYYHYGHEKWKHDQYEDFYVGEVIAWMNIPEPYNPDRKED